MAGVKPELQFNSLQAGVLPIHESNNPTSERYKNGMEECSGGLFKGGRLTHAPWFSTSLKAHAFPADFVPWPDNNHYKINTQISSAPYETFTAKPADNFGKTDHLNERLANMMAGGKFLSKDPFGTQFEKTNGKYDFIPVSYTDSNALVLANGETIKVPREIKYVRGVTIQDDTNLAWGVIGKKSYSKRLRWKMVPLTIFNLGDRDSGDETIDETSKPATICRGSSVSSLTKPIAVGDGWTARAEIVDLSISINPEVYTIPAGTNITNGAGDIYLVGVIKMFNSDLDSIKDPRDYSYTASSHYGLITNCTIETDRSAKRSQRPQDDLIYVLRWGSGDTGISYLPMPNKNDDTRDIAIQALLTTNGFTWTPVASVLATPEFFFTFARNRLIGLRRFGICQVRDPNERGLPTSGAIGFTKLAKAVGDGNVRLITTTTDADNPYVVFLDGPPIWVEASYQGVFCGTTESEYIISNEQSATNYSVRKISSIGATKQSVNQDYADVSAVLNGAIYFLTARGIANLRFSNESQAFLPSVIDLVDYGFGIPKSIACSKKYNCLIITTDTGKILTIYGDTGAISEFVPPSVSTPSTTYTLIGARSEKGEPVLVFADGSTNYKMISLSELLSGTYIRTTRFFFGIDKICIIKRVHIVMSQSFGGRVRVYGNDNWSQIEYSSEEISNQSFTGTKSVPVFDVVSDRGIGKSVEIEFSADEPMNIIGISVEGEN